MKSPKLAARTKVAAFKITPEQYRVIEQRAERCGVRVSAWMRSIVLQAASRPAKEGHIRVQEPNRITL
jgi:hypothetical protein